ncbi:lysophospholipid acyltransferase LPEAT1-like isoform X1 [Cucurbita moschata]|uniref:Lysophospholipid acyltransferase LPEAT1-like isoform X1 n=1 Tax=Cucurbita moschata TaxID=3662 RepID=A0A6J1GGD8_CUCMO|nr:lysophospholipid acyltransferase LPEAT1-like isoform X1 [Cucurbita moschata]
MASELQQLRFDPPQSNASDESSARDDRPLLNPDSGAVADQDSDDIHLKYAPFSRRDAYGTMGRGELPWMEKVLLGMALITIVPIRVVFGMSLLFLYYMICRICTLLYDPNRETDEQEDYAHMVGWRRSVIVWSGRFVSRAMLFVLGFYWISEVNRIPPNENKSTNENEGQENSQESERPGVIISNHVSYLDILYHMSSSFPSFVAKRSVAKLPLVGIISKCLGCVYVQRESKTTESKGVSGVVSERIREAVKNSSAPMMMLFPEGTTTNGEYLLPFKTGAFLSKAPVLPLILRYPYQRFSLAWESMAGGRHFLLLLCQFVNHLEVIRLPVYVPSQEEKDDPKLYASNIRRFMAKEGNMLLSDIGLPEKRVYLAALNGNNNIRSVLHQKDD